MRNGRLRVVLITLGDPGRLTGGYLYHRRLAALAAANDADVEFVSFPERVFPFALLHAGAVLRATLALKPDVAVLDSIAAAFAGPALFRARPALPLAAMVHQGLGGIDHSFLRTRVQIVLDRLAYRRADLLILASESLLVDFTAAGFPRDRLRVVPPGHDVAAGLPPAEKPVAVNRAALRAGRRAAFLCVGNWMRRKGIAELLDAFARLPEGAGMLHLVGDTATEPGYARHLRRRIEAKPGLAGRVTVHGALPAWEVGALYEAADVFVLPSYREPYGTVYGEAMAAGLPVVGWKAGNLPYLARHGLEGLLVPPGDVRALAFALHTLARDEALRGRMGRAARQRAEVRPTWERTARVFFDSLRELA